VWERVPVHVPGERVRAGLAAAFADYFKGESRVRVESIDDIVAWVQTCEYVHRPRVVSPAGFLAASRHLREAERGDARTLRCGVAQAAEIGIEASSVWAG